MNTVKIIMLTVLFCCTGLRADESSIKTLARRKFTADNYKQVRVYCHGAFKASAVYSPDGVDGSSGGALAVTVDETPDTVPNGARIQVRVPWTGAVSEGTSYRVIFHYRAEKAGAFSARAIRNRAPWSSLGGKGLRLAAASEWQKAEMIFTATENFSGSMLIPNLEIANIGRGNTLYLCNIIFESLD